MNWLTTAFAVVIATQGSSQSFHDATYGHRTIGSKTEEVVPENEQWMVMSIDEGSMITLGHRTGRAVAIVPHADGGLKMDVMIWDEQTTQGASSIILTLPIIIGPGSHVMVGNPEDSYVKIAKLQL